MTGTELVGLLTGRADLSILNNTKPSIKDTVGNRLIALIGFVGRDFHHTSHTNVFRVGYAELNSNDSITHVYYYLSLCVYSSVFEPHDKHNEGDCRLDTGMDTGLDR